MDSCSETCTCISMETFNCGVNDGSLLLYSKCTADFCSNANTRVT